MLSIQAATIQDLLFDKQPYVKHSVLDIGGGHGQLADPLAAQGFKVVVAGSSEQCSRRIGPGPATNRIGFAVCDLLNLPFNDGSFDVVITIRLISHMQNWRGFVEEICRVARHSIVIDYPTLASLNALSLLTFGLKRAIERNTRPYRSFWPSNLYREFARHGFEPAASRRQFTFPMAAHRLFGTSNVLRTLEEACRRTALTQLVGNPVILKLDRVGARNMAGVRDR